MQSKIKFSVLGALVLAAAAGGAYWYQHQKTDGGNTIKVKFNPIEQTSYGQSGEGQTTNTIYPLNVEFSGAAAPIDKVKSEITQGIKMEPAIEGKWIWSSDYLLSFTPTQDWPTGQEYKITLDKKVLNPSLTYAKSVTDTHSVKTQPFSVVDSESEFYQDPNLSHIRHALTHLVFSNPVDPKDLEKAVEVNLVHKNQDQSLNLINPLKFKIRYSDNKLEAWIRSDELSLSTQPNQFVQTKISQALRAKTGANTLEREITKLVQVPSKYSLQNSHNSFKIVNNQKNEADQVLTFNFNYGVKGKDIADNLSAVLLPEPPEGKSWEVEKLTEAVVKRGERIQPELIPSERPYANNQSFRFNIPEGRCLYLQLDNKFTALGGYQLKKAIGSLECAPNYPTYVNFVGKGSLLSQYGDGKVTLAVRNTDRVRLDIGRVQAEQLRHVANLNSNNFQKPDLGNLKFDDIATFKTETLTVANRDPRKSDYLSVDLSQRGLPKQGIFWVKASAVNAKDKSEGGSLKDRGDDDGYYFDADPDSQKSDYRLIILTDLGIIAKKAADGTQSVFVQSIASGAPVSSALVKVISRNNTVIASQYTNRLGVAQLPSLENYKQELEPVMYLVARGQDQSFLPIDKSDRTLDFSRFDIRGQEMSQEQNAIKTFLFNDRGIYRPGESVHIGMISKALDLKKSLANVPLTLEVTSPSGKTQWQKNIRVSESGFNELTYPLSDSAETGEWLAHIYIGQQQEKIDVGSMTFQVQEFEPDTLRINTMFDNSQQLGWVSPQDFNATVHLTNLFGTPAQKRRVAANIMLHAIFPSFPQYKNYQFYDNQRNKNAILLETELQDQTTDNNGNAIFALNLEHEAENTVQMLYFTADGYENNSGRGVSKVQSILVSAQPWLVGYSSAQDLNYLREKSESKVNLIAINPSLQKTSVRGLSAVLMERKYVSVLTEQRSGAYKYESKMVESQLDEKPLNIDQNGSDFALNTERSGDFVLVINNQYGETVNRIPYTVIGNSNVTVAMDKNTELKLNLNKKQFMPGEEIEVAINAPYAGSGLITIERERVYTHKWFKSTTNRSVQKIRIPENFEGSGYINVQFSRDMQSDDIFTSPLSYGVAPFSVNVDNHRLKVNLSAPQQVKSGEKVKFTLSTDRPSKAVIYAVNEGILQVAGHRQEDPLQFFFPKYALQVETLQILDLILPEFRKVLQFAQTGGDAEETAALAKAIAANTNPFKRRTDKPAVFWSNIIDVDGTKTVTYQVPQGFNGNLKVMAIAVTNDGLQMNIGQTETLVRDDMVLSPTAPITLAPNDETKVSLTVSNNTKSKQNVLVQLNVAPQFQVLSNAQTAIMLEPMSEGVVNFQLKATDQLGSGILYFTAAYLDEQQQPAQVERKYGISVRPLTAKQQFIKVGEVAANQQVQSGFPNVLFPQLREQTALISPAPLALAQGISSYLGNYDNLCTEQIISAAIPNLLFANNPEYQSLLGILSQVGDNTATQSSKQQIESNLNRVFSLLPARQTVNEGFGLWSGLDEDDGFLTAYVAHFLIEAQEHGVQLPAAWITPNGLFNKSITALERLSRPESEDDLAMLRQRAYATYLLARLGQVPSDSLLSIRSLLERNFKAEEWRFDLTVAWLAGAYQLVKQEEDADNLISNVMAKFNNSQPKNVWFYRDYLDPLIEKGTVLYVLARHFPEQAEQLSDTLLSSIVKDLNDNRYNTLSSAMVLLALDAYSKQHAEQIANLHIQQDGQNIGGVQGAFVLANINADKAQLNFVNQSTQKAWYTISQSGYVQQAPAEAIKNGVEIDRTYLDQEGKPVTSVKLGDVINVQVRVRSLQNELDNMVITDLYPAGFEVVNSNGDETVNVKEGDVIYMFNFIHRDLREDRMLSYGSVGDTTTVINYQLKAVNAGKFQIPRAYTENMYNRTVNAQSADKGYIEVIQ
ncbi:alpha-2-macroglobulin family protein [Aggregatibacter actinomycetemcomitans]|uniref:alpha-2-macroglobulin n=1 Tax=Aggregatibacter actinomycetemcomitans TaxID=714 RepID=UPI0011DD3BB8|nr:alpha-2-macroglobulin [Aggregatibacter actinomycetemcomitans]QEH45952.1 alpha-2-macroglobulin family protein [Aggregatibacter actinomycetemcomitans]